MTDAQRRWTLANTIADCDCDGLARKMSKRAGYYVNSTIARGYSGGAYTRWANQHEYWNYGKAWHLLVASLVLDGLSSVELP